MLTFKLRGPAGLKILEAWFARSGEELRLPGRWPHLLRLFHAERCPSGLIGHWQRRQTLITRLATVDDLFALLSKTVRYDIRRCRDRDGLAMVDDWTPEQVIAFADEHDPQNPNRPRLARLEALRAIGRLLIRAAFVEGKPLCVHAIVFNDRIARGLYTYTARRTVDRSHAALVGRATKASDFDTLLHLRDLGLQEYDWGGFTGRPGNGIDAYKREFRGELRQGWVFTGTNLPGVSTLRF